MFTFGLRLLKLAFWIGTAVILVLMCPQVLQVVTGLVGVVK